MIENKQDYIVCQTNGNGENNICMTVKMENTNNIAEGTVFSDDSDDLEIEENIEDDEYIYEAIKTPKKKILSKGLCIVADKYQCSNREILEIAGQTIKDRGDNIDDYTISYNSSRGQEIR